MGIRGRPKITFDISSATWANRILAGRKPKMEGGRPIEGTTLCRETETKAPLRVIAAKADAYQEQAAGEGRKLKRNRAIELAIGDTCRRMFSARLRYLRTKEKNLREKMRAAKAAGDTLGKAALTEKIQVTKAELEKFECALNWNAWTADTITIQTVIALDRAYRRRVRARLEEGRREREQRGKQADEL